MPIARKICRVCGKPYEACRSAKREAGVFHWQEVACSPECGTEYLRMVTEARNPVAKAPKATRHTKREEPKAKANTNRIVMESDTVENQTNVDGEGYNAAKEAASE